MGVSLEVEERIMQHYGEAFARVYNARWAGFAEQIAPRIQVYYESTPLGASDKTLLDVGCGTGHLALNFLLNDYQVMGIDLSPHMIDIARESAAEYVAAGKARFIVGNAADFRLDETFGCVVSTFDMLNHLPDEAALRGCFRCVFEALKSGGSFVFDLNTREGLRQRWNTIQLEDTDEFMIVQRGIYDGGERAHTRVVGFARRPDGLYDRFEETVYNTVFALDRVKAILTEAGFNAITFVGGSDLSEPVADPELLGRAFVIAHK
jgi:SAM-dependent methyltransferase